MYAVGTPIPGSNDRNACVYFRPRQSTDRTYFKIEYGDGCSANVSTSRLLIVIARYLMSYSTDKQIYRNV